MKNSKALSIFCILFVLADCHASLREPAVAGSFYPANPQELASMIDTCLKNVPPQPLGGKLIAFLVPHAGYVFSAQTAAYSYKQLEGKNIENVIIIGNSHHFYLNKGAVYAEGEFKTPLGNVKINSELTGKILAKTSLLEENISAHAPEHSIEVQLPFLQKILTNFKIVPILLSQTSLANCEEIAKAVASAVKESGKANSTLIIASSDMSHYPSYVNANMVDAATLRALETFDVAKLKSINDERRNSSVKNLECTLCGEEAVYTVMYCAKLLGATDAKVLKYSNSGDAAPDKSRVVGYSAVAFYRKEGIKDGGKTTMGNFKIGEKNQKELLSIARNSIEQYLKTGKQPSVSSSDKELLAPAAVFVTLSENGRLRGCIGATVARLPMYQAVSQLAVSAAVEDNRFQPVIISELKNIHIEISVLSPLEKIKTADEIKPKYHGVVVKKGYHSGLFLPQVWEQLPGKEEFMNELCSEKAGLAPEAWKDKDTELYTFTVFAFKE